MRPTLRSSVSSASEGIHASSVQQLAPEDGHGLASEVYPVACHPNQDGSAAG